MSTKSTIAHGDDFHIYQEIFEGKYVYLQIDKYGDTISIKNNRVTLNLSPHLLDKIATAWLENRKNFEEDL